MTRTGTSEIYMIIIKDTYEQYVGKTNCGVNRRIKDHLRFDQLVDRKMKKHGFNYFVIETCTISNEDEREIYYIDLFQTNNDLKFGGLNLTSGGEGGNLADSSIQKCRDAMNKYYENPENRKIQSERMKKICGTPEFKTKKSAILKKSYSSPKLKEQCSLIFKAMWATPGFREKRAMTFKNNKVPEKISTISKENWKNPEYRKKQMEAKSTPEHKQKKSQSLKKAWTKDRRNQQAIKMKKQMSNKKEEYKKIWSDPEKRKKQSETMSTIVSKDWKDPEYRKRHVDAIHARWNIIYWFRNVNWLIDMDFVGA